MSDIVNDIKKSFKEYEKEINNNIRIALDRTMAVAETRLNQIIQEKAISNFYKGYFPHIYDRTYQLPKAIKAYTEDTSSGDSFSFTFGPSFDESTMDHSSYKIHVVYTRKKDKKIVSKDYTVNLKNKPNEEAIMEMTLGEGLHPLGKGIVSPVLTQSPIYNKEDQGVLADAFEEFIDEIPTIFENEISKFM